MKMSVEDIASFEAARPRLFEVAYGVLGNAAEADDVVQDTWARWQGTDRTDVRDAVAFLVTTTKRLALNVADSARARRETYVGPWLPERVDSGSDPALEAERRDELERAVRVLLERLSPTERAAYVLREAFDYPYRRIAQLLELTEGNARQLVTRARVHLLTRDRISVSAGEQRRFVDAFVAAAETGNLKRLEELVATDLAIPFIGRPHVSRLPVGVAA
jgi:RNA polymerase sigma-70 factor (ECF subfamily)